MALDGIMIAGMVKELKDTIEGGKINKIAQPENDELMITIKKPADPVPPAAFRRRKPSSDLPDPEQ